VVQTFCVHISNHSVDRAKTFQFRTFNFRYRKWMVNICIHLINTQYIWTHHPGSGCAYKSIHWFINLGSKNADELYLFVSRISIVLKRCSTRRNHWYLPYIRLSDQSSELRFKKHSLLRYSHWEFIEDYEMFQKILRVVFDVAWLLVLLRSSMKDQ
jgi:hypothetical protein